MNSVTGARTRASHAGRPWGADFAALIEAAYRSGESDAEWLDGIVGFARVGLDRGLGVVGCLFSLASDGRPTTTVTVGTGPLTAPPERLAQALLDAMVARVRPGTLCHVMRLVTGGAGLPASAAILALDRRPTSGARAGLALLAPLPIAETIPRGVAACWVRVAAHLDAGLRLRRTGSLELLVWRGLLAGRWDLVDHFDTGGRRFIVARRPLPAPPLPSLTRLSMRERAACAQAARGRSNKVIASELGIAISTAGMLLLRATRKLQCASREDLIRIFRSAEERWTKDRGASDEHPAPDGRTPFTNR